MLLRLFGMLRKVSMDFEGEVYFKWGRFVMLGSGMSLFFKLVVSSCGTRRVGKVLATEVNEPTRRVKVLQLGELAFGKETLNFRVLHPI